MISFTLLKKLKNQSNNTWTRLEQELKQDNTQFSQIIEVCLKKRWGKKFIKRMFTSGKFTKFFCEHWSNSIQFILKDLDKLSDIQMCELHIVALKCGNQNIRSELAMHILQRSANNNNMDKLVYEFQQLLMNFAELKAKQGNNTYMNRLFDHLLQEKLSENTIRLLMNFAVGEAQRKNYSYVDRLLRQFLQRELSECTIRRLSTLNVAKITTFQHGMLYLIAIKSNNSKFMAKLTGKEHLDPKERLILECFMSIYYLVYSYGITSSDIDYIGMASDFIFTHNITEDLITYLLDFGLCTHILLIGSDSFDELLDTIIKKIPVKMLTNRIVQHMINIVQYSLTCLPSREHVYHIISDLLIKQLPYTGVSLLLTFISYAAAQYGAAYVRSDVALLIEQQDLSVPTMLSLRDFVQEHSSDPAYNKFKIQLERRLYKLRYNIRDGIHILQHSNCEILINQRKLASKSNVPESNARYVNYQTELRAKVLQAHYICDIKELRHVTTVRDLRDSNVFYGHICSVCPYAVILTALEELLNQLTR